ncbi:MAG TPA: hypothetical protein PK402_14395 [Tepidisphaeraceae bacterium]|nr:hypothetical protein [Tepidisphaeraceae bacterium]
MSQLFKQSELRRFIDRRFERRVVWLPAERAVIGLRVTLDDLTEGWEVVSVSEPALPASLVDPAVATMLGATFLRRIPIR